MQQDFVTVATYSRPMEAHVARSFLEENGIRAFVADENSAALEGWSILVNAKLQVAAVDVERAKELLSETGKT